MKKHNHILYDSIIKRISKSVKYALNEEKYNFDTTDYTEDNDIDIQTVDNIIYKYFPKTIKELEDLIQLRINENPEKPYLLDINTSSITTMSSLFTYKGSIKILDLSTWDTSNVKDMDYMFFNCYSLTELNLSGWDTSNVVNMYNMFFNCNSLTRLDLSSFDTSKVINMDSMFSDCNHLTELDLSNFDTSNVIYMDKMFFNCSSLSRLDLSNFDITNIPVYKIFDGCASLKYLYTSDEELKQAFNLRKYRSLNEAIENFDVTDYQEQDDDLVDYDTTRSSLIKKPKSIQEEASILFKLWPSEESEKIVHEFLNKIEKIFEYAKHHIHIDTHEYSDEFNIFGYFKLNSRFSKDFLLFGYDNLFFNFYYNPTTEEFIFDNFNESLLAKVLTFSMLYNNELQFSFQANNQIFKEFKWHISNNKNVKTGSGPLIFVTGDTLENLLNTVQFICQNFVDFADDYLYTLHEDIIDDSIRDEFSFEDNEEYD